jgi:hypothetical protein
VTESVCKSVAEVLGLSRACSIGMSDDLDVPAIAPCGSVEKWRWSAWLTVVAPVCMEVMGDPGFVALVDRSV